MIRIERLIKGLLGVKIYKNGMFRLDSSGNSSPVSSRPASIPSLGPKTGYFTHFCSVLHISIADIPLPPPLPPPPPPLFSPPIPSTTITLFCFIFLLLIFLLPPSFFYPSSPSLSSSSSSSSSFFFYLVTDRVMKYEFNEVWRKYQRTFHY